MNPQKAGTGMIAAAFIIGLILLTLFFSNVEENQRNPNRSPESRIYQQAVEVALERNRQGHYVVTGTINHEPVEYRGRAMTANGWVTVYQTTIEQLTIGDIVLSNVKASINPSMDPPAVLLGMSALKQVEFIQKGESLTLRQVPRG
jgi:aspartyl protease family protein